MVTVLRVGPNKSGQVRRGVKLGFERSRLGGHDLWQKVPSSPVTRNRLTRRFVRYASDFISCKREYRRHETQL